MSEIKAIAFETHCPTCKTEYENIGHPLRPGVIMMRTCKCKYKTITNGNNVVIELEKK